MQQFSIGHEDFFIFKFLEVRVFQKSLVDMYLFPSYLIPNQGQIIREN